MIDIGVKEFAHFIEFGSHTIYALQLEMRRSDRMDGFDVWAGSEMVEHRDHVLLLRESTYNVDFAHWVNLHKLFDHTFNSLRVVADIEVDVRNMLLLL